MITEKGIKLKKVDVPNLSIGRKIRPCAGLKEARLIVCL